METFLKCLLQEAQDTDGIQLCSLLTRNHHRYTKFARGSGPVAGVGTGKDRPSLRRPHVFTCLSISSVKQTDRCPLNTEAWKAAARGGPHTLELNVTNKQLGSSSNFPVRVTFALAIAYFSSLCYKLLRCEYRRQLVSYINYVEWFKRSW